MSDILKVNPNSKFERNLLKTNKRYDSTNWWHFTDFPMLLGTNLNPSCLYLALTCLIFWLWRTASYYFSTHCSPRYFSKKYQFMHTIWQMSNLLEKNKRVNCARVYFGKVFIKKCCKISSRIHHLFISWKEKILDVQTGNGLDSPVPNLHSCSKG